MSTTSAEALGQLRGAFVESLRRNNKQIREDRALAIVEDAEMIFKRRVEDIGQKIKRLERERESMLDLSPTDTRSLVLASDFDAESFVQKEEDIALKIRQEKIRLEELQARYAELFAPETATV